MSAVMDLIKEYSPQKSTKAPEKIPVGNFFTPEQKHTVPAWQWDPSAWAETTPDTPVHDHSWLIGIPEFTPPRITYEPLPLLASPEGFKRWLQIQDQARVFEAGDALRCPLAQYLLAVTGHTYQVIGKTLLEQHTGTVYRSQAWVQAFVGSVDACSPLFGMKITPAQARTMLHTGISQVG